MKFLLFYVGFIWAIAAILSLGGGRLVGLDTSLEREKLRKEWASFTWRTAPRKLLLVFAFLGFLFPLIYPIWGLLFAIVSFLALVLTSR